MVAKRCRALIRCQFLLYLLIFSIPFFFPSSSAVAQTETAPFPGTLVEESDWDILSPATELTYLGSNRILSWDTRSNRYQLWRFDPTFTGSSGDFPQQQLTEGTLQATGPGLSTGGLRITTRRATIPAR